MPAPPPVLEPYFTPIYIATGIMIVVMVLGLVAPRGPHAGVLRSCISLSAFCIWLFWLVVYMAQMNPIMCPRMSNRSLAWVSYKWGLSAEEPPTTTTEPTTLATEEINE